MLTFYYRAQNNPQALPNMVALLTTVCRVLHYTAGPTYFLSCSDQDDSNSKVASITRRLQNSLTKPLLLFLTHVLPAMDKLNTVFQKSKKNTTCMLHSETTQLVKLYAANLLNKNVILAAGENLKVCLDKKGQLNDENLGIGTDTQCTWV